MYMQEEADVYVRKPKCTSREARGFSRPKRQDKKENLAWFKEIYAVLIVC